MKTQSLKSLATLLGVAVALNLSALAGPGPQPQFQPRTASQPKKVVTTVKSPSPGKSVIESRRTFTQVSGPRGVTYAYRGIAAR